MGPYLKLHLLVLAVFSCVPLASSADTITLHLNQSTENYTLNGTGGSNGFGTYLALPGACTAVASVTTCQLTGTFSGSTPGYTGGSYALLTSFDTSRGGLDATSTTPVSSPSGGNYFVTGAPTSDVNVSLELFDITGFKNLPLIVNGVDLGNSVIVSATNSTCTGLPSGTPCTQGNVGLSNTASIFGPVTGEVTYSFPMASAPEPSWLALGGMAPGALLALRRRLRRKA